MLAKKRHPWIFTLNVLIFTFVLLFDTSGFVDLSIDTATPMISLALLTAFAIFASVTRSAVVGFIVGAVWDSMTSGSYCFNTVAFFLLGAFISLAANNLFNKNIRASIAMAVIVAVIYFTARWLCFMAFGVGIENSLIYLLSYGLPSALYSAVFIFPCFYLYRYFNKLRN